MKHAKEFSISRQIVDITQLWIATGDSSLWVNLSEFDPDQSPTSSFEIKSEWSYDSTPSICLHGVHKDYFSFLKNRKYSNNSLKWCSEGQEAAPYLKQSHDDYYSVTVWTAEMADLEWQKKHSDSLL